MTITFSQKPPEIRLTAFMAIKLDSSVTNASTMRLDGKLRMCQQCGTHYYNSVEWAKYCSKACKQVAYRSRKGIEPPNFLKSIVASEAPYQLAPTVASEAPKVVVISPPVTSLAFQDQEQTVRRINNEVY